MAKYIVSNTICREKSKCRELIYYSTIICETLSELEPFIKAIMKDDSRIKLLFSIKDKWIERFKS
jgi:hypothetical protein